MQSILRTEVDTESPGTAKTLRIMPYTLNWGRLPKVGLGLVPGLMVSTSVCDSLLYRGEIFIYFVDFPGMIRHIPSVCANSSGVERIYSAYSLGVRNGCAQHMRNRGGVRIPLQLLL